MTPKEWAARLEFRPMIIEFRTSAGITMPHEENKAAIQAWSAINAESLIADAVAEAVDAMKGRCAKIAEETVRNFDIDIIARPRWCCGREIADAIREPAK